ncbi:SRPBCC family protein [Flavihumibacter petaseus]|uniref:Activator of Hsp90 ATPase homologue 1/2-like C-terminal domain-containing protein n=1 Tax=Flavihumibacter petaseus NBRC 106054 TaxID=1220578 RepID=A0A0E9MWN5_9BACT|nr:SRPBCC domain-containing protein [Flavihumibacter petaseus]GAO41903.1 hypothetical protein FPE01S_01_09180 [Flavihumibacter petaseus NBRC 106054]
MKGKDFSRTYLVDQSPETVFNAVTNVRGWWSEMLKGNSAKEGDEFEYRHKDLHYTRHLLTEVIPDRKVEWLTTDSLLTFVEHQTEWTGTTISFDISREGDKTKLVFTHHGLTPSFECYNACNQGWSYYLDESLLPLITSGKGKPDAKETSAAAKSPAGS